MNFYERYCGDYGRDTGHLSLAQHGAFTIMLDTYYSTEKPLPPDYPALYRICRAMNKGEQDAVRVVADEFFPIEEDGLRHNARADAEIADAQPRIAAARLNGKRGGRPKKAENETQQKPTGFSLGNPAETHAGVHHAPHPINPLSPPTGGEAADAARAPDCPHEKIVELYHETMPLNPRVLEWNDTRRGYLRARWREKSLPNGRTQGYTTIEQGLLFWRRFFSWCGESKFLTGQADAGANRRPFVADLEWLLRPSNFAKVIEGKYHQ